MSQLGKTVQYAWAFGGLGMKMDHVWLKFDYMPVYAVSAYAPALIMPM